MPPFLIKTDVDSLNQLKTNYKTSWNNQYTMITLYKLWYKTNTLNNTIIECRAYYYNVSAGGKGSYFCNYTNYNTTTGLYQILVGSGVYSTPTDPKLTQQQLSELTLFYDISQIKNINLYSVGVSQKSKDIELFVRNVSIDDITKFYNAEKVGINILTSDNNNENINGITYDKTHRLITDLNIANIPALGALNGATEWNITWKVETDGTIHLLSFFVKKE